MHSQEGDVKKKLAQRFAWMGMKEHEISLLHRWALMHMYGTRGACRSVPHSCTCKSRKFCTTVYTYARHEISSDELRTEWQKHLPMKRAFSALSTNDISNGLVLLHDLPILKTRSSTFYVMEMHNRKRGFNEQATYVHMLSRRMKLLQKLIVVCISWCADYFDHDSKSRYASLCRVLEYWKLFQERHLIKIHMQWYAAPHRMRKEIFVLLENTDFLQSWSRCRWTDTQLLAEFWGDMESMSGGNHSIEM